MSAIACYTGVGASWSSATVDSSQERSGPSGRFSTSPLPRMLETNRWTNPVVLAVTIALAGLITLVVMIRFVVERLTLPAKQFALPPRPEDFSEDLLSKALKKNKIIPDHVVIKKLTMKSLKGGVHFRVAKATLEYEGATTASLPRSVVIKQVNGSSSITTWEKLGLLVKPYCPSLNLGATIEELAYRLQGYLIELQFYSSQAKEVNIPIPECFFSYYDYYNVRFVMVMEDLSECDNGEPNGFNPEQAKAMLRNLARLHAQFWNSSSTDKKLWSYGGYWLGNKEMSHHKTIGNVFESTLKNFPIIKQQIPDVHDFATQLSQDLERLTSAVHVREPKTLIHGDYKISNIFIDMQQHPIKPYSIDWQWMGKGCAATDVSYFIYTSLSLEDEKWNFDIAQAPVDLEYPQYSIHEMSLLRAYHDELVSQGIKDYPFPLFEHQYSTNQIYFTVFCLREKWSTMTSTNMTFFNDNRIDGLHLRNTQHMVQMIKRSSDLLKHINWDRVNKRHRRAKSWRNKL